MVASTTSVKISLLIKRWMAKQDLLFFPPLNEAATLEAAWRKVAKSDGNLANEQK